MNGLIRLTAFGCASLVVLVFGRDVPADAIWLYVIAGVLHSVSVLPLKSWPVGSPKFNKKHLLDLWLAAPVIVSWLLLAIQVEQNLQVASIGVYLSAMLLLCIIAERSLSYLRFGARYMAGHHPDFPRRLWVDHAPKVIVPLRAVIVIASLISVIRVLNTGQIPAWLIPLSLISGVGTVTVAGLSGWLTYRKCALIESTATDAIVERMNLLRPSAAIHHPDELAPTNLSPNDLCHLLNREGLSTLTICRTIKQWNRLGDAQRRLSALALRLDRIDLFLPETIQAVFYVSDDARNMQTTRFGSPLHILIIWSSDPIALSQPTNTMAIYDALLVDDR